LVLDGPISNGPASGIAAALRECRTEHLIVLAIDLPLMTSAYFQWLGEQVEPGLGVVPGIGGRFEPVAAIYPRECLAALSGEEHSLQLIVRDLVSRRYLRPVDVAADACELFRNINHPLDLPQLV
jgi:molybdopterin-guanine dinucleotide biosynthesis protein A